ncbi:alpha-ketoglutarate-dependent dioxygenase alkB homolog 7, mitochondrial-like [Saccostrea echinata]|uniref:alpha-ketoglutarate-dependent dioxygenase alkB homolog 7, mitochondrial-like n=1 Tax=Saccostrea echinata TaxID=191078 RepID=UPI002A81C09A|nr:alpha-ketoglutarate-dependent dioxygenase alkB homolog 7, mitochondrial-like [Saccostrea echinata]
MSNFTINIRFFRRILNQRPLLQRNVLLFKHDIPRFISNTVQTVDEKPAWIDVSESSTYSDLIDSFVVYNDFISEEEECSLMNELDPYMRRLRYERDHWDDAIHGYRETERRQWNAENSSILKRVSDIAFPPTVSKLAYVHILDLEKTGVIKPHIDAVRFCGNTIAGLSLLSTAVMRLTHDKDDSKWADILLSRRSLYIMRNNARYLYKHAVLDENESNFKGQKIQRDRRVSVIMRNEPDKNIPNS